MACSKNVEVKTYLNENEQLKVKMDLCRYMDILPPNTKMQERWSDSTFKYYMFRASSLHLLKCYKNDQNEYYYLTTKVFPSIRPGERRASIGKFKFDGERISHLHELYLSNILPEETLIENADELFAQVVNNNKIDTTSKVYQLIECPNAYFDYDTIQRSWERRVLMKY